MEMMRGFLNQIIGVAVLGYCLAGTRSTNVEHADQDIFVQPNAQVTQTGWCGERMEFILYKIHYANPSFNIPEPYPEIAVCYNQWTYTTLWTYHKIFKRVEPSTGKYWAFNPAGLSPDIRIGHSYTKKIQWTTINRILEEFAELYVRVVGMSDEEYQGSDDDKDEDHNEEEDGNDAEIFLAKGHLAPNADYKDHMHRGTTYYYINAVPQWQIINNGNWLRLEEAIRQLAPSNGEMGIYTGTSGVLTLRKFPDCQKEIRIGVRKKSRPGERDHLPVPRLMWKCFQEPSKNGHGQHYLFVVYNNPWERVFDGVGPGCENICHPFHRARPSWVWWDTMDVMRGYTHCCKVDSCPNGVKHIAEFPGLNWSPLA